MQCLRRSLNVTCPKTCRYDCISLPLCGLMCGDVILVSIVFSLYLSTTIVCITMYFFSVFLFLLVCQFLFLVASFDGLRPLLVTSQCSIRSFANKLRSFVCVTDGQLCARMANYAQYFARRESHNSDIPSYRSNITAHRRLYSKNPTLINKYIAYSHTFKNLTTTNDYRNNQSYFYLSHSYSIQHGTDYKIDFRLSVSLSVRLRALSRSHLLIDFHQNWH